MQNELPELVHIPQACEWLQARTGTPWTLSHLLNTGLVPFFWLDYSTEAPAIFGDRFEGVLCRMLFEGDLQRLRVVPGDALATVYELPDGRIMRAVPGVPVPRDELVFKAVDVVAVAQTKAAPAAEKAGTQKKTTSAQDAEIVELFNRGRGISVRKLAEKFEVSRPVIDRVLKAAGVKN